MSDAGHRADYHSLLGLHHSIRLRRSLRGDVPDAPDAQAWYPVEHAPTINSWPERAEDQRLLRESLDALEPLDETLGHLYTALFRDRPFLRPMFPQSLLTQRERLRWSLLQLIESLDRPELVVEVFEWHGREHRKLGVRPAHYTAFADALLESLRVRAGASWHQKFEDAWTRVYWFIARLMIESAEASMSEPPYVEASVVYHERRRPDLAVIRVQTAQPYAYLPGQHATVESPRLPRTWRCYSMADLPNGDGILEFHVRATGSGRLSDVLVHQTAIGDVLRLGPARGGLILAPGPGRDVLLAAGGTGLAPIRALLADQARRGFTPLTWLFFGARTRADLYDLDQLASYARRWSWLRVVAAVSHEDRPAEAGPAGAATTIEYGALPDVIARQGSWLGYDAYLSGPRAMVASLRHNLPSLGVAAERIRYDLQ
jgi:NAD(P)H-flavin reductase/hemoglobin-like flavoprotein